MYKIYESPNNQCSVEFPFLTSKKRKKQIINEFLLPFRQRIFSVMGEICSLDFTIEKIAKEINTSEKFLNYNQNGYGVLTFLNSNDTGFSNYLDYFDCCSDGYYVLYLLPKENISLVESTLPLIDHKIDCFLIRLSVHADSTYFEFEFQNELIRKEFLEGIK